MGVAVSPDSKRALSGTCEDRTMRLWDLESGKMLREYRSNQLAWVYAVAFSPDGKQALCTGNEFWVWLWDLESGKVLGQHTKHVLKVETVAFSPDGKQTVSASADRVAIWDLQKMAARTAPPEDLRCTGRAAQFLPDNRGVLIGGEGLWLWDSQTGKKIRTFEGTPEHGFKTIYVSCLAVAPDGRHALTGSAAYPVPNSLWLWDVATGREVRKFRGHRGEIRSVAFAPDGKTAASAGTDNMVRLWDVATGRELWCFEGHTDTVWSIAFSPDGRHLLSGGDVTMRLWALKSTENR
jgi:WD40 repeat protein